MGAKKSEENRGTFSGNIEIHIRQFGRFCAWSLIVMVFLYFLSGYGISKSGMIYKLTGGILHRNLAFWIHEQLTLPMAFAFICHTLIAIRFAMIRWQVKNLRVLNYVFAGVGVVLFGLAVWIYLV